MTHPPLVVVQHPTAQLPRWVHVWRRRTHFELIPHLLLPSPETEVCPGCGPGWPRVVADVTTATAAGAGVLINRVTSCRPSTPRVIAAVRELSEDRGALIDAAACAAALEGDLVLAHCVPLSFAPRSVGLDAALSRGLALLHTCLAFVKSQWPSITVSTRLFRTRPHELVSKKCEADLLVIGASGTDRLGPLALSAVQCAPCPVLLIPHKTATHG
jgi:nucleotide-binding universal stress UspA family protein